MKLLAQGPNKHTKLTKKLQGAVTPRRAAINSDTPITFTCGYCRYTVNITVKYVHCKYYLEVGALLVLP